MKFTFKAKTKDGTIKRGSIDAVDKEAAVVLLQKNELIPLTVREIKDDGAILSAIERWTSAISQKVHRFQLVRHCEPYNSKQKTHSCV